HRQPRATSLHRQPRVTSLHRQPRVTSLHRQPRVTSLHRQPRVTSLHRQPRVTSRAARSRQQMTDESYMQLPPLSARVAKLAPHWVVRLFVCTEMTMAN
ncbi:TPA: hypothetical protein PXP49_001606, partial [Yersinia enterocolitica]|nr:hypothetical protein [Yersinia enterocolitica]